MSSAEEDDAAAEQSVRRARARWDAERDLAGLRPGEVDAAVTAAVSGDLVRLPAREWR